MATTTLRDGRTIEYFDVGDPAGVPVVLLHGTPGTGSQAGVLATAAEARGVRLVAPTRPGYGASTFAPPGLASTARDTVELADHLGLERFAVLGASGGGPFGLAVAVLAPERLLAISLHGSPARYSEVKPEVLGDDDRRALDLAAAGDVEQAMQVMDAVADADLDGLRGLSAEDFSQALGRMAPPDGGWFGSRPELKRVFEADFQRAITTSAGMSRDNLSWLRDWDIDPAYVTPHVRLVYGAADRMSEPAHGEWLHARLPNSTLDLVPGDHGTVVFGMADELFASVTR